jgi:hypothetical protein
MGAFTIDLTGLGASITTALTSMGPLFILVAGLTLGAAVLSWGVSMIQRFRGGGKKA